MIEEAGALGVGGVADDGQRVQFALLRSPSPAPDDDDADDLPDVVGGLGRQEDMPW